MNNKFNLSQEQNVFLAKKVLVSNIYNSAKLEGLNVTYPDTQTILDGVNIGSVKLDEINVILNLRDAWKEMLNSINDEVTIEYICKINYFVSRNESLEWGKLRNGTVGIAGTNYIPPIPKEDIVKKQIQGILSIQSITEKSIKLMLYCMKKQLFWDGNKRTSMIIANKIMIKHGKGIITVKEENIREFNILLSEYYETDDDKKILSYIYDNCIFGLELM